MIDERGTTDFQNVPVGAEVFTADGERLGEIKEVRQGSFKVNAAMQPDYWLPVHSIASTTGNRVTLSFGNDRLGDYKSNEPLAA
jgi:Uncharacterized protein conserved in bacteria (DUF2171)